MGHGRGLAAALVLALLVSACGSSSSDAVPDQAAVDDAVDSAALPLQIQNQGGSMEGHTPRGFAGSGTGLFAGDNLNGAELAGVSLNRSAVAIRYEDREAVRWIDVYGREKSLVCRAGTANCR